MTQLSEVMQPPILTLTPNDSVGAAIAAIRAQPRERAFTYPMIVDGRGVLVGICTMRDLILALPETQVGNLMLREPLSLMTDATIEEALARIKGREIPEYPVCDAEGKLVGVVRAARLHELEENRLAAIPGTMVGVADAETVATNFRASVRSRLPWLMINLLTAFAAGLVVGNFQATIDKVVLLAAFLPVLAGQSGNTGAQALAITLRTLDRRGNADFYRQALWKELRLGVLHGIVTGILIATVIYVVAYLQGNKGPGVLAMIGFTATLLSVVVSGLSGASVPVALKNIGTDPAAASSIILTTVTDVVSMGSMLLLATLLISYLS